MNLLVDTHLLLWSIGQPEKLPDEARRLLVNPDNHLIFSAASMWEIAIKRSLERADFQVEPSPLRRGLLEHGWTELLIRSEHAIATGYLPLYTKIHSIAFCWRKQKSKVSHYSPQTIRLPNMLGQFAKFNQEFTLNNPELQTNFIQIRNTLLNQVISLHHTTNPA